VSTGASTSPQGDLRALAIAADKLRVQGDLHSAIQIYERLVAAEPQKAHWLALLGDALIQERQANRALELIDRSQGSDLISSSPALAAVRAKALLALGYWAEALDIFQRIVECHPTWADGWNNLACCLLELGRSQEAIPRFRRALQLDPAHVHAARGLVGILKTNEDAVSARAVLDSVLERVDDRGCRAELIVVLLRLGEFEEALAQAHVLCAHDSVTLEDQMLLARALFLSDHLEEYIATLDTLPGKSWKGVSTESIAIGTMAESGQLENARHRLNGLLERDPTDANGRLILARDLLSQGEWRRGWREYAHRLRLPANQLHFGLSPNWNGQPLNGQTVLVIGEQGIGDVCYFSRFLRPLLAANPATSMICEPRMIGVLESSFPDLYLFSDPKLIDLLSKPLVKIAMGSLPLLYGNTEEEIQNLEQPLCPRPADVQCWQERLDVDANHKCRIGISLLAGRPSDEYQRRKRSLPIPAVLEQLAGLPLTLVDLQHQGHPHSFDQEAERLGLQVLRYPMLTDNLGQLTAVISCLDGVLTAQQTNAHLCGVLGQKGVVILPPASHFIYGTNQRSTWYPSLELIRARIWGEWSCISEKLPQVLCQFLI
jgi:tetratricopeptide (TPR) repeat protein